MMIGSQWDWRSILNTALPRIYIGGRVLPIYLEMELGYSLTRTSRLEIKYISGYNAYNEADVEMVSSVRVFDLSLATTASPTCQPTLAPTEAPNVAPTDRRKTMTTALPLPNPTGSDSFFSGQVGTEKPTLDPAFAPSIVTFNPMGGQTETASATYTKSQPVLSLGVLTASTAVALVSLLCWRVVFSFIA
jgi:hypothetical protein